MQGSDLERAVFSELRQVFVAMNNAASVADRIPLLPFVEQLSTYSNNNYLSPNDTHSLQTTWDDIVSVILAVNPQLWEIFLGTGTGLGVNLNVGSSGAVKTTFLHCYRAVFQEKNCTISDVLQLGNVKSVPSKTSSPQEKATYTNQMTLKRTPLLLVVSTQSSNRDNANSSIKFSDTLDLRSFVGEAVDDPKDGSELSYDLVGIALSGGAKNAVKYYFKTDGDGGAGWLKGVQGSTVFESVSLEGDECLTAVDAKGFSSLHIYARHDNSQSFKQILLSLNKEQVTP